MVSTCPSCLNQVNHEDHLFEVICECGTRFNPFLTFGDSAEPQPKPNEPANFEESQKAFQEIQSFGESIGINEQPPSEKQPTTSPKPAPVPTKASSFIFTSADALPNHSVEQYLPFFSLWTECNISHPDPLKDVVQKFIDAIKETGANVVLSVRWQLSQDTHHILITGTPAIYKNPSE